MTERAAVPGPATAAAATPSPTVVIDDVHITYRTASTQAVGGSGPASAVRRRLAAVLGRGHRVDVSAVRGVSLVARRGDVVGLVGRNGSGKSTLLRAVAGFMTPTSGAVYTSGETRLLGVNAALVPDLSGERNILLGCLAQGMTRRQVAERFDAIVEFAGIGDAVYRPMRTYSSGMGARLRFAIATASQPEVLLIDEALGTGDAEFRARSERRIEEMRAGAGTIFLVSHNLGEITGSCNRVVWMHQGEVAMDGAPEQVVAAYTEASRAR